MVQAIRFWNFQKEMGCNLRDAIFDRFFVSADLDTLCSGLFDYHFNFFVIIMFMHKISNWVQVSVNGKHPFTLNVPICRRIDAPPPHSTNVLLVRLFKITES